jgi:hypothetical protein
VTGTDDALGKPQGSDERHGKLTYVSQYGLDEARRLAAESHANARAALHRAAPDGAAELEQITDFIGHPPQLRNRMDTPPRILDSINRPQDLHDLDEHLLPVVAQEVREHIITRWGRSAGTSAPTSARASSPSRCTRCSTRRGTRSSGTSAHQAYPHKVLTGRRDQLSTIRKYDGLAPFLRHPRVRARRHGAGHASTSIGYGVGLKEAMRLGTGEDGRVGSR